MDPLSRQRIEAVVDAVTEVFGIGPIENELFEKACEAALKALLPKNTGYLTVVDDAIEASLFRCGDEAKEMSKALVRSRDELVEWCKKWDVDNFMCSSSIDFPEDSTDNTTIIALCCELRS